MVRRWNEFSISLGVLIILSIALYFSWFRHLSTENNLDIEDPLDRINGQEKNDL
jgi:hypothetical protein